MNKALYAVLAGALALCSCSGNTVDVYQTAVKVSEKGLSRTDLGHYMGTCLYHGMADLALASGRQEDMDRVMNILSAIASGEIPIKYKAFIDYEIGGQSAALLAYKGQESLMPAVKQCAAKMWAEQPRTPDGVMTGPDPYFVANNSYWIDIAFTVTPFFLYAGLLEGNTEYVDFAAFEALKMCEDLYDPSCGLFHQGYRHKNCPEGVDEAHWSRANGWMSMALGCLLRDYPRDGRYWEDILSWSEKFYEAVCRYQDEDGMWHQEMTDLSSYVETSGSGQLLAGIGAAISSGAIDRQKYMPCFERGLKGLLSWVDPDGSVGHCCRGNLVPGTGKIEDLLPIHWYYNENHVFGPVVLALAQALELGIRKVRLDSPMGSSNTADRPRAYARLITERKNDFAWENDRVAFRVYSQQVANKAASGVDFWAKTVDYPVIDEWYARDREGGSYHIDCGSGCDFYNMGTGRGVGGTGVWDGEKLVCPALYRSVELASSGPERIDFTLTYDPYEVGGVTVTETKRIEMVCETSFYKVTHTLSTSDGSPLTLAVGVQGFGNDEILCNEDGKIFIIESFDHNERVGIGCDGGIARYSSEMGSAVLVCPSQSVGYMHLGKDHLQLLKVESGQSVEYFVGAMWSFQQDSGRWTGCRTPWRQFSIQESWASQQQLYAL